MDDGIDMNSRLVLKMICIIFENCEFITIPIEEIKSLIMKRTYTTIAYDKLNKYSQFRNASLNLLEINKEWLKANKTSLTKEINNEITAYERLIKSKDIVSIELYWQDLKDPYLKTNYVQYYLPWGKEEYENEYQIVKELDDTIQISVLTDKERLEEND